MYITEAKQKSGVSVQALINVKGTLNATGAIFTSYKDDSQGGDTNGDGTASTPAKGDWNRIIFEPSSSGLLDSVIVRYGGNFTPGWGPDYKQIKIESSNVTIKNSTIRDGLGDGIYVSSASPEIINNQLVNNPTVGIVLISSSATVSKNTISGSATAINLLSSPGAVISGNTFAEPLDLSSSIDAKISNDSGMAVVIVHGGTLTKDLTFEGGPIWYLTSSLTVEKGATLTIPAGVIVKLGSGVVISA